MYYREILGMRVHGLNYRLAVDTVVDWARRRKSAYVCVANVHMVMESFDDTGFRTFVNEADLVTPDGMPLVWALRLLGIRQVERVYGPDLSWLVLSECAKQEIPIGFYGSTPETLRRLRWRVLDRLPSLQIAYMYSPPFGPVDANEDRAIVEAFHQSGARVLFVGLGCPKQERWMAEHRGVLKAPMLGVGAAFDFLSGTKPQSPRWMMKSGLEWLFRFATEPTRLWRRYLKQNPRFVLHFARQLLTEK
jgi:N-acetylglucosaminyldiphosphoundecaprenol N-acetyl-beta-D-mannosaminyltransferase